MLLWKKVRVHRDPLVGQTRLYLSSTLPLQYRQHLGLFLSFPSVSAYHHLPTHGSPPRALQAARRQRRGLLRPSQQNLLIDPQVPRRWGRPRRLFPFFPSRGMGTTSTGMNCEIDLKSGWNLVFSSSIQPLLSSLLRRRDSITWRASFG
jgi:hypothetical protein